MEHLGADDDNGPLGPGIAGTSDSANVAGLNAVGVQAGSVADVSSTSSSSSRYFIYGNINLSSILVNSYQHKKNSLIKFLNKA